MGKLPPVLKRETMLSVLEKRMLPVLKKQKQHATVLEKNVAIVEVMKKKKRCCR